MFSTDIGYEQDGWFSSLNGKYTGQRYYTYLNDAGVDAYWLLNASTGYKQKNLAGMKDFSAQLSITNLLNNHYYSTIGSNGFVVSDTQGAFATMQEGAPRQLFVTVSGKF
jgi:iron complex outermembrane receptor protein